MTQKKEPTGKPAVIKEVNIGLLKDALLRLGQATRVTLARETGISQPTVNFLIKELTQKNVVLNLGMADSTGGRRAELYTLNLKQKHLVSVIVRKDALEYCVWDLELNRETEGIFAKTDDVSYAECLMGLLEKIFAGTDGIESVTVGVPGAVSDAGQIFAIPQIPEWEQFPLKEYLREQFDVNVTVVNDINAVAMGYLQSECKSACGDAARRKELIYLHVTKSGMGAGIIVDGKLFGGHGSFAGEVGYMRVADESIEERLLRGKDGERTEILARVVTNLICVLDPWKIVLGGGVTEKQAKEIRQKCQAYLPMREVPEFTVIADGIEYYFLGLGSLGLDSLDRELKLS